MYKIKLSVLYDALDLKSHPNYSLLFSFVSYVAYRIEDDIVFIPEFSTDDCVMHRCSGGFDLPKQSTLFDVSMTAI